MPERHQLKGSGLKALALGPTVATPEQDDKLAALKRPHVHIASVLGSKAIFPSGTLRSHIPLHNPLQESQGT